MNVFSFTDYRVALRALVKERKQFMPEFGFHSLAEASRVQRPYLSKVMKGAANLSSDQMFLISKCLTLNSAEHDFLQMLLERERSAVEERRRDLDARISAKSSSSRDSQSYITARPLAGEGAAPSAVAEYYLDPIVQIVHIALSIERYSRHPAQLIRDLNTTGPQIQAALSILERLTLAEQQDGRWIPREPSLHLPKSSPLYRAWRNQVKLLSAQRLNQVREDDAYAFSTTFSCDEATRRRIHDEFLAFLRRCEEMVKAADAQRVMQMSFDLFPWT